MIAKLIDHAVSRGCYISSIFVSDVGESFDIVSNTITALFDANGGDLNSTMRGMLELFNWSIRDPADVYEDIYLLFPPQSSASDWDYNGSRAKSEAAVPLQDHGTMITPEGAEYVGNFKDGKPDGHGTLTCANGDEYVGNFKDGAREGHGTWRMANGNEYVGGNKDDKPHGQGTYTFANGEKYVGNRKAGNIDGHGTYNFANGDEYVGSWKDNKPEGHGTYSSANGEKYVGEFKDGKPSAG
jgi:hypothetical protein